MKKSFLIIVLIICVLFASCDNIDNPPDDSSNVDSAITLQKKDNTKEKVINMFITYGEYSNGCYRIREYSTVNSCDFLYTFSYNPEVDLFNSSVLTTTHTGIVTMYDYGSVTFSWNGFENALFYGYHELKNTAIIEFHFDALSPQTNMTYGNYNYSVKNNTFRNLTNTSEINRYAQTCFDSINQSLLYAQSVLCKYTQFVTLW